MQINKPTTAPSHQSKHNQQGSIRNFPSYSTQNDPYSSDPHNFQNQNDNIQNLQSQSSHGNPYKSNESLRESVHDLMREMESALTEQQPIRPSANSFHKKKTSDHPPSVVLTPGSQKAKMLSTMEHGSQKRKSKNLKSDRSEITRSSEAGILGMAKVRPLPQLEVCIMQQILLLREEKITLMQAQNQIIDRKYGIERELARCRKATARTESTEMGTPDSQNFSPQSIDPRIEQLQDENQFLKNKIKDYQKQSSPAQQNSAIYSRSHFEIQSSRRSNSKQEERCLLEIEKYSRLCKELQEDVKKKEKKYDVNRFETFLPADRQKLEFSPKGKSQSSQRSTHRTAKPWNNDSLTQLRQDNHQLMNEANTLIAKKRNEPIPPTLNMLQQIIELDQAIKEGFFEEVRSYKRDIPRLKEDNQRIQRMLNWG